MESIDFIFIEKCGEGNKQHISSQKKGKKKKKGQQEQEDDSGSADQELFKCELEINECTINIE